MEMIKLYNVSNAYSFIDAGCGNGWLVRYLFENTNCEMELEWMVP